MRVRTPRLYAILAAVAGLVAGGRPAAQVPLNPPPSAAPVWHVAGEARGTPLFDGEAAFFLSAQREVLAIDARTGGVRWRTSTGVQSRDDLFGDTTAGTSLAVDGATIVAGDWDVIGFDRHGGRRLWTYTAPGGDGPGLFLGPATDGRVYAGSPEGQVYAIDTSTGGLRWRTPVGPAGSTAYRPALARGVLAVGFTTFTNPATGGVAVLDPTTGHERWRVAFPAPSARHLPTGFTGGPIVTEASVVAAAGDGNIYEFDLRTGHTLRRFPRLSGTIAGMITSTDIDHRPLARVGGLLVAGSVTGTIVAYDLASGDERWRFPAGYLGSTTFGLSADETSVYLPFLGGFLIALDGSTGRERWRYGHFTQGFIWAPAPGGRTVFASASRAGFYALAPLQDKEPPR